MTISQAAIQVLAFVTAIVIARFLSPFEVGLAAEALVFASLALVIVDFGFASVLVQRPALSEDDRSTAFWAGMFLGVALTLIGIAASWPIASIYGEPEVQPLFAVLSLAFLFTAPGIVQGALLTRDLAFRSLEVRTIIATTMSCATGIGLAIAGAGAWAIVAQDLVITAVSTLLLWRASSWRPQRRFSMRSLRGMAGYTGNVFGTRVLAWGTINLDNFLIGRFVGAAQLGAYTLAYSVVIMPATRIATPDRPCVLPGVLAGQRAGADRDDVDAGEPDGRADHRPVDARSDRGRPGVRPRRLRREVERGDPGDPDPRDGRVDPGALRAERADPAGARSHQHAVPVHLGPLGPDRDRLRGRPAVGDRGRRRRLPRRHRRDRAGLSAAYHRLPSGCPHPCGCGASPAYSSPGSR